MKKKSIKTKIKNLLIGTFTFSSLFGGNPAQAQSTNAQEEFRKEQRQTVLNSKHINSNKKQNGKLTKNNQKIS